MRHAFANKKLNRTSEHRKALLKNMLNSLVKYEQIKTTLPKGKFLKPQADKLITLGKKDTLQTSKLLVSQLQDSKSANKVKKTLSKRYEKRNGGYTRIIKAGFRYGDNAPMAIIEFVDRDVEARRVDKKKKETSKEEVAEKKEDKLINGNANDSSNFDNEIRWVNMLVTINIKPIIIKGFKNIISIDFKKLLKEISIVPMLFIPFFKRIWERAFSKTVIIIKFLKFIIYL